ncbi:MAG TPA: hypothetical protein VF026_17055 [Ktedonobacteraceae bacterium]
MHLVPSPAQDEALLATIRAIIYLDRRRKRRFSGASALLQRKKRAKATQNIGFRR